MALNERQKLFVKEYLISQNATEAAKKAGYSDRTAYSQGQRLLKHVEVAKAIQTHLNKTHKKLDITVERIQEGIATLAFGEVSANSVLNNTVKLKALELLGKSKAMFTDNVKTDFEGELKVQVTFEEASVKVSH